MSSIQDLLYSACENGNSNAVVSTITKGANPADLEDYALHLACENGNWDTIQTLVNHGASLRDVFYFSVEAGNIMNVQRVFKMSGLTGELIDECYELARYDNDTEVMNYLKTIGAKPMKRKQLNLLKRRR